MIPRILHHVWPGRDPLRPAYAAWRAGWIRHHPDWSLVFWRTGAPGTGDDLGDPGLRRLLAPPYGVVPRADVLRWYALATWGGVYADTDVECLRSFEDLLSVPEGAFCSPEPVGGVLSPAVAGAAKGHPFARDLYRHLLAQALDAGPVACNLDPIGFTGPRAVTAFAEHRRDFARPAPWLFHPAGARERSEAYAAHHWMGVHDPKGWRNRLGDPNLGDG